MPDRITIKLPWPDRSLHSNSRAHWAVKHRHTKAARGLAKIMVKSAKLPQWPNAVIMVEAYPPTRRGDPHNIPVACKAYIDGIQDAMGCDDRHFRVNWPDVWAGTKKGGELIFHIMEN